MTDKITAADFGLPEYENNDEKVEPYILFNSGSWAPTYVTGNSYYYFTGSSNTIWYTLKT